MSLVLSFARNLECASFPAEPLPVHPAIRFLLLGKWQVNAIVSSPRPLFTFSLGRHTALKRTLQRWKSWRRGQPTLGNAWQIAATQVSRPLRVLFKHSEARRVCCISVFPRAPDAMLGHANERASCASTKAAHLESLRLPSRETLLALVLSRVRPHRVPGQMATRSPLIFHLVEAIHGADP